MNTSDLKLKIFREVDSMENSKIEELYGVLNNFINGQKKMNDWEKLSSIQKQGIMDAIDEIDAGKGIQHNKVINKYRKKYSHA